MTTVRGGNKQLAQYESPSDIVQCTRCGIWRKSRPNSTLCRDCRTVEHHTASLKPAPIKGGTWTRRAGIWRWVPDAPPKPARMSADDMAWCERQAQQHFWTSWERANRRAGVDEQTVREAIRKVA
jgi:hypothetical protein